MLLNGEARKTAIMNVVVDLVKKSQKEPIDSLIFMFAGHGIPDNIFSHNTNSFLAPYDAMVNQFFHEGSSGTINNETFINKAWLVKQLSAVKASSIIIILDSCYSGAKDFGELFAKYMGFAVSYDKLGMSGTERGLTIINKTNNVITEKKIAFIASSKSNQVSTEYKELQHGALSYCIFQYINNVRKATYSNDIVNITVGSLYSNIENQFDNVQVRGASLSSIHQPVLYPIPSYDDVNRMKLFSVRGIKPPEPELVQIAPAVPKVEKSVINTETPTPKSEPEPQKNLVAALPTAQPKHPEPKPGTVEIITEPVNAEVYVNGEKAGQKSNCILSLSEGNHFISLYIKETNYKHTINVNVKNNTHQKLNVLLRGSIGVEAYSGIAGKDVPVLNVYLDGRLVGNTGSKLEISDIVSGTHMLMVKTGKVVKERQVEIRQGSPLLVRYKIIKESARQTDTHEDGVSSVTF
jgi:hypothetical protein